MAKLGIARRAADRTVAHLGRSLVRNSLSAAQVCTNRMGAPLDGLREAAERHVEHGAHEKRRYGEIRRPSEALAMLRELAEKL